MKNKIWKFIIAVAVCEFAGMVGSIFTAPAIQAWYVGINKPSFNPPNWIFAPVWTTLFLLMGVSLFLVWTKKTDRKLKKSAMVFFCAQLALNIVWSIIFFGLHSPAWAFADIIALWVLILLNAIYFYKISKAAGWLYVPYLLWVAFASVLNFVIWKIN
ncbi:MAG: TspO/MBR family protein [Candidatus Falkowbacteria bacterium]